MYAIGETFLNHCHFSKHILPAFPNALDVRLLFEKVSYSMKLKISTILNINWS